MVRYHCLVCVQVFISVPHSILDDSVLNIGAKVVDLEVGRSAVSVCCRQVGCV